ncbi:MAG TPA: Ig-like domain-containing protein [Thermoanaerobaculia bacterium]|nr:Ig-like domain-containing protein [Thermoanaerobaculia bacterium]
MISSNAARVENMHRETDRARWNRWYAAPLAALVIGLAAPGGLFAQPTITKSFNPSSVQIGERSTLTFTINNPAGSAISAVAFTDNFPANLFVATPNNLTGSCGSGTITATAGTGSVSLSAGTIAASGSCMFSLDVIVLHQSSFTTINYVNTTSNVTASSGTGSSATATLAVNGGTFAVSKGFSPNSINTGDVSTLTFTITSSQPNPTSPFIDQVADLVFQDVLPAGLVVATPNGLNLGTCAAATPTITATPGSNTITLGNPPLFAGGGNTGGITLTNSGGAFDTCSFSVNVTPTTTGSLLNTITTSFGGAYPLVSNDGNNGSATLNVGPANTPPVANPDTYSVNQGATLTVAAPGVLGNDTDPDGDALHAVPITNAANGNVALNADGSFTYTPNPAFACGVDSFTYKANDGFFDSNIVTVTINVIDTQAPSITASVAVPVLWPPNHDLVNVGFGFSTADNGCGAVTTQLGVFSNEPDVVSGDADGNFSPDATNIGAGTLRLRSERENGGDGPGRVYLIRVTATDSSSNTGNKCVAVVVPPNNSPKAVNDAQAAGLAAASQCTATGLPPAGYVPVGVGPVIGPKQ